MASATLKQTGLRQQRAQWLAQHAAMRAAKAEATRLEAELKAARDRGDVVEAKRLAPTARAATHRFTRASAAAVWLKCSAPPEVAERMAVLQGLGLVAGAASRAASERFEEIRARLTPELVAEFRELLSAIDCAGGRWRRERATLTERLLAEEWPEV